MQSVAAATAAAAAAGSSNSSSSSGGILGTVANVVPHVPPARSGSTDPSLPLPQVKRYEGDVDDLGLYFSVEDNFFGASTTHDLLPGGSGIPVSGGMGGPAPHMTCCQGARGYRPSSPSLHCLNSHATTACVPPPTSHRTSHAHEGGNPHIRLQIGCSLHTSHSSSQI